MAARLHTHVLPYAADQLYDLVADVASYPQFLPGCLDAKILSQSETELVATLTAGHGPFQDTYTSQVHLTPKTRIDVAYMDGPFRHLTNYWIFHAQGPQETRVEFFIDFQFQNKLFQKASQFAFEKAFGKVLEAFEKRARVLYGGGQKSG